MTRFKATLAALAVALVPAGAHAQDEALSAEEVRTFFEDVGPQAQEAVTEGDWRGIQNWMRDHVSDDARIALMGSFVASDGPTMTFQASMRGIDIKRTSALSMAMMGPQMMGPMIEDYTVAVEVRSVTELPQGLVAVDVAFREHGLLDLGAMAEAAGGQPGAQAAGGGAGLSPEALEPKAFMDVSDCSFRVAREDGTLVITLAACETVTTM